VPPVPPPAESERRNPPFSAAGALTGGMGAEPGDAIGIRRFLSNNASVGLPVEEVIEGSARVAPGPSGIIEHAQIDPLAFLGRLVDQYGDVVRYQSRFAPCFVFAHPAHGQAVLHSENYRRASLVKITLGEGLLATDGPYWRSQRKLMQRDFMPARVAPFASIILRHAEATARIWNDAARSGKPIDVTAEMTQLTLRIIVEALFSHDMPAQRGIELCDAITQTLVDLGEISWMIFGSPMSFGPHSSAKLASSKAVIDGVCYEMIAARRAQPPQSRPRDLLTLLIEAHRDDGPLNDRQLRDEMVTMLVGGHETTALALSWAWLLLAQNPAAEARLHEELSGIPSDQSISARHLPSLRWTNAVFQEAMRLYPPVWYMARVANKDDLIDGYAIPRGSCVMISAWLTHRHPEFWNAPQEFRPQRFFDDPPASRHRYAYFPFGGGRHQCLGMHLAQMEGTLLLARLARQFRLHPQNASHVRPLPGITLRQLPGLRASVELRKGKITW
jgi:cytochrome P450